MRKVDSRLGLDLIIAIIYRTNDQTYCVLSLHFDSPIIIGSLALPTPLWLLWDGFDEPYQSLI